MAAELDSKTIEDLASDVAARFADAIDNDRLQDIPDDSLGQLFASVVRAYAAKVQNNESPRVFGRNSGTTPTDVMIGVTGMLDGVNLQLFEVGLWQSWSGHGGRPKRQDADDAVSSDVR